MKTFTQKRKKYITLGFKNFTLTKKKNILHILYFGDLDQMGNVENLLEMTVRNHK